MKVGPADGRRRHPDDGVAILDNDRSGLGFPRPPAWTVVDERAHVGGIRCARSELRGYTIYGGRRHVIPSSNPCVRRAAGQAAAPISACCAPSLPRGRRSQVGASLAAEAARLLLPLRRRPVTVCL